MKDDGNCLFRSLCFGLHGLEINYPKVCQLFTNHISENYTGGINEAYLNDSKLRSCMLYRTDNELAADFKKGHQSI